MEHIVHLLLLIILTRLIGELFERVGQPVSVGEIVAGIVIALVASWPMAESLSDLPTSPFLDVAADFGIFFILLLVGIEMRPREIVEQSASSLAVAMGGVFVPLVAGFALAWIFLPETPLKFAQALLVGVALSISAVPVAAKILMEFKLLHCRIGEVILSAAIFDDVIGLVLLAILLSVIDTGAPPEFGSIIFQLAKVSLFFVVCIIVGRFLWPKFCHIVEGFRVPSPHFSALLVLALGFSYLAESLGMNFILGPFVAGLLFEPETIGKESYDNVKNGVREVTDGLLAPLFFASIGVRIDLSAVTAVPVFLSALLTIAFLGKILGAGVPARLAGMSFRDSTAVGIGMSGRGAVELIIVSIALDAGLFDHPNVLISNLFSALVITAVVTTIFMPIALRALIKKDMPSDG